MGIIEVKNLQKSFKVKTKKIKALDGLSFDVKNGEIYGFLGPNGAGKSTTIKIIMDLIRADDGYVKIFDKLSTDYKAREKVGFMPENPQYYDNLSGYDLLMMSAGIFKMDKVKAERRSWELLELFELKDSAKKLIRKYSKGMIQRIGFASAIIHEPELLILDEPMSGLDPLGRVLFKNIMKELNSKGVTIFFSSHIIPDIEEICSKVILIKSGKIVQELDSIEIKHLSTFGFQIIVKKNNLQNIDFPLREISNDLISIDVSKQDFPQLINRLKDLSVEIVDIIPIKNSLEDIFLNTLKKDKI
ncbi:MAG: ABC transporter ATP-binding protein [Deferribacterales bacterium]